MAQSRRGALGRSAVIALLASATVIGAGSIPAHAAVSQVSGGAFGYRTLVGLFGGPKSARGPAGTTGCSGTSTSGCSPEVTLPSAGGSLSVTDADGARAVYGPAVLFESKSMTVSTEGSTGPSGTSTSSALVEFNPDHEQQVDPFNADSARSTCSAAETGQTASTVLTNASLVLRTDPDTQEPVETIGLPTNPAPNTEYSGTIDHVGDRFRVVLNEQFRSPDAIVVNAFHMYLLGDIAVGELIIGQSRCGVTATSTNLAPVANDDSFSVLGNSTLTVPALGLLANDTDPEGRPLAARTLHPVAITSAGTPCPGGGQPCVDWFPSDPDNGTLALRADGSFTYTPKPGFLGTESFGYIATDPRGGSDTGTVTINVTDPLAVDDFYRKPDAGPLLVQAPGVLRNDVDMEGGVLTAGSASDPPHGVVFLDPDGSFKYIADALYQGLDTFTYTVRDAEGGTDTGLVTITVGASNAAPVAVDDNYVTDEDTALTVAAPGLLGNDSDANGDPLTAGSASDPANGTVTVGTDGAFTYTPDPNFAGTDTFTYAVRDGWSGTDTGLVTIAVSARYDPPAAADDAYLTQQNVALTVPAPGVLGNDAGDALTAGSASDPANGTVAMGADGSFTYTPDANFTGTDPFTYVLSDGAGGSDTGTVIITVPERFGRAFGYHADNISLFGGAQPDAGPTPALVLPPGGTATNPTGLVRYGPATLFSSDQIQVDASETTSGGGSATTSANLLNVNSAATQGSSGSEIFGYPPDPPNPHTSVASTCAASPAGVTRTTTITNGILQTDSGWDDGDLFFPEPASEAGGLAEHAATNVTIPADPAANTEHTGHIHLSASSTDDWSTTFNEQLITPDGISVVNAVHEHFLGPILLGELTIGHAECVVRDASKVVRAVADFDGDGDTDRSVFRNGAWYAEGQTTAYLGQTGDIAVPGDYDGDRDADHAVYR
ncbi:MAG TPA: Ig-like domain-containing protein, partial [Acidimicrobiales bacterium]|nr:Ig-like domain-containing protein [Acidimicrobiales bacterium]